MPYLRHLVFSNRVQCHPDYTPDTLRGNLDDFLTDDALHGYDLSSISDGFIEDLETGEIIYRLKLRREVERIPMDGGDWDPPAGWKYDSPGNDGVWAYVCERYYAEWVRVDDEQI